MDRGAWLKLLAIVLSALVVTWVANAPLASREIQRFQPAPVPELASALVEQRRIAVFDQLVGGLLAQGLDAGWQLDRGADEVVLGVRGPGWASRYALRLRFAAGGLGGLSQREIAIERWLPAWPAAAQRRQAETLAAQLVAAQAAAVAGPAAAPAGPE